MLHAAIINMEFEESEDSKPKIKVKKEKAPNSMWENLSYLEQKS